PAARATEPVAAAAATDPVCGMAVEAGPDSLPLEHDGVTYYFCCAGCRQAFERDPAAYGKRETRC
ncbi:MAG: YHS domain-containing protein, partial [Streptosporangiaceae bacterium]